MAAVLSVTAIAAAWWLQLADVPEPAPIDFSHFYALGYAVAHPADRVALVDHGAWQSLMERIVPGRSDYPLVYGPQAALWFAPWALVSLPVAYVVWNALSFLAFSLCVAWIVVRLRPELGVYHFLLVVGTVGFPALAHLLMNGHATVIAVVGLAVATGGLVRRSALMTGLGLALLSFKPTLFLPVVVIAFLGGEVVASVVALGLAAGLLLLTIPVLGVAPLEVYAETLIRVGQTPDSVANPAIMASLRTLASQVLPDGIAGGAYLATATLVVLAAAWAWRRTSDPLERLGVATLATVLASPHVYNYDLVITFPAFVCSIGWAVGAQWRWKLVAATAALAYATPALPLLVHPPVSPTAIVNAAWFVVFVSAATRLETQTNERVREAPRPAAPAS